MLPFSKETFATEEDKNDFYIAIPVIALAAIFILWQWNKPPNPELDIPQAEVSIEIEPTPGNSQIEKIEVAVVDTFEIDKSTSASIPSEPNVNHTLTDASSDPSKKDIPVVAPKHIEATEQLPIDVENALQAEEVTDIKDGIKVAPNDEKSLISETVEVEKSDNEDRLVEETINDCSIAVGLYKSPVNLNKMYNRLLDNGYSAVIVPLRNSKKVSLKIPCDTNTSQRILREIRSSYASDAYIE